MESAVAVAEEVLVVVLEGELAAAVVVEAVAVEEVVPVVVQVTAEVLELGVV